MANASTTEHGAGGANSSLADRFLNFIERTGNRLPTPAMLFIYCLFGTLGISFLLSLISFDMIDPRSGQAIAINNLIDGHYLAVFLASSVKTFTDFAPLGVVLVAIMGVGVAESSGFINTTLKKVLRMTPARWTTPMVVLVGVVSNVASDAGYVLVIPLGGIIFQAAGRHPLAGLAAAFAGVSGGFSASLVPTPIEPMVQSFTQAAAQLYDPDYLVNPLSNFFFTFASTFLLTVLGWFVIEKIVEPRLNRLVPIDKDLEAVEEDLSTISALEQKGFSRAGWTMIAMTLAVAAMCVPETSPFRNAAGELSAFNAPIMGSIVPLIFLLFLFPAMVYGYTTGKFKNSGDVINSMTDSMGTMSGYIIMAFFCALFLKAFGDSNIGTLIALGGAEVLQTLNMPGEMTIIGIILLTAIVNLFIGSLSAKWALIGPIFVPMLMAVGISPELAQAAYRVGDSSSNIITPMMNYYPLVVVFFQRYLKSAGIGTVASTMLPLSAIFLVGWTAFLLLYWALGLPMGIAAPYTYPAM